MSVIKEMSFDREVATVVLHKLCVRAGFKVPSHVVQLAHIDAITDNLSRDLTVCLTTYVSAHHWSEKIGSDGWEDVPETWLDAVRLRFAPMMFLSRWPIKTRRIQTRAGVANNYWVFPEVPPNPNKDVTEFMTHFVRDRI